MSEKGQMLRAFVNARLSAAAEEIFALFERTVAEFEEELRRSKTESQRKQELLDSAQNPTVLMVLQTPSESPDPGLALQGLKLEISETPRIKEEPEEHNISNKHVQAVCVKTEELQPEFQLQLQLQPELQLQLQPDLQEDARGEEDISAEPYLLPQTDVDTGLSFDTDKGEAWRASFVCSEAQMETEANEHHHNVHVQSRRTCSAAKETTNKPNAADEDMSENDGDSSSESEDTSSESDGDSSESDGDSSESDGDTSESEESPNVIKLCPFCQKRFVRNGDFENHIRVHTGEKPFSCSVCSQAFVSSALLKRHMAVHSMQQNSCSICKKTFTQKGYLQAHMRIHTGERPYSCPVCNKAFPSASTLYSHKRVHTGDKSYECLTCGREFLYSGHLKQHMLQHAGVKPFSCSICAKRFTHRGSLLTHEKIHNKD